MSEDYRNPGFAVWGETPPRLAEIPRTLVVLGAPRGGTSAIAGALVKLGLFLGDNAQPPVFEDLELASRMERAGDAEVREKLDDYDRRHPVWAYKRPGLAFSLERHHEMFRNPIYLVVFRDIFAAANRGMISSHLKNDITIKMARIAQSYQNIITFLGDTRPYALLFSYEKLLQSPAEAIDFLVANTGIAASPDQRAEAARFIVPQPKEYLQHARANRCEGAVDRVDGDTVLGWARYVSKFVRRPAKVDILLDGARVATVVADQPAYPGCSYHGAASEDCCFRFRLPPEGTAAASLRARVNHEPVDLDNSPLPLSPERH